MTKLFFVRFEKKIFEFLDGFYAKFHDTKFNFLKPSGFFTYHQA